MEMYKREEAKTDVKDDPKARALRREGRSQGARAAAPGV